MIFVSLWLELSSSLALLFEGFLFANAGLVFLEIKQVLGDILQIVNLETRGHL